MFYILLFHSKAPSELDEFALRFKASRNLPNYIAQLVTNFSLLFLYFLRPFFSSFVSSPRSHFHQLPVFPFLSLFFHRTWSSNSWPAILWNMIQICIHILLRLDVKKISGAFTFRLLLSLACVPRLKDSIHFRHFPHLNSLFIIIENRCIAIKGLSVTFRQTTFRRKRVWRFEEFALLNLL